MLKGAYAHLSPSGRLLLLIVIVFSFLLFSTLIGILALVPWYGSGVINMLSIPDLSNPGVIAAFKVLQIINMAGGLLLPALVYLWLCDPGSGKFAGLTQPAPLIAVGLSIAVILIAQPVIGWTSEINSHLSLPEWLSFLETRMKSAEIQNAKITEAFLSTTSAKGLIVNIFMIAILPAFSEEILFRGVLAELFRKWTKSIHLAVFISSFIFAAIHMQFYGFLPRFLLGMALGYLFFWSGSLWLPIAAHFANNFLSVIVEFLFRKGIIQTNAENLGLSSTPLVIALSIVMITGVFYYLYKITSSNTSVPINSD